jgi:acetyl esterase/lipase
MPTDPPAVPHRASQPDGDSVLRRLVDPESLPALDALLEALPDGLRAIGDLPSRRAALQSAPLPVDDLSHAPTVPRGAVIAEDRDVEVPGADRPVRVRIYRSANQTTFDVDFPAILYIHGGGLIYGDLDVEDDDARLLAAAIGAVVVSVDYRLAPEYPYPAAVTDCVTALRWIAAHASDLRVDPSRIALFGGSAGGCLAIATALHARDHAGPAIALVMAPYPMLDNANDTPSSHEITDLGIWDRADNIEAWQLYLGQQVPGPYAVPARTQNLRGLPPMFLDVGTVDLFRDETITFAQRLAQAAVPVELHVHAGAYHASESIARDSAQAARIWALRISALSAALRGRPSAETPVTPDDLAGRGESPVVTSSTCGREKPVAL